MSAEQNQPENDFSVIEELTAYLDGELDQDQIQQVETRLVEDTTYLAEMQSLQKTWDLLDSLPASEPGTSFTKTTMELVVGEAVKSEKKRRNRGGAWLMRIAILVALPSLLFAIVFNVIRQYQTESDRLLVENLSVIENHPRYEAIECDLDFLVRLSHESLFTSSTVFDDGDSLINLDESDDPILIPQSNDQRRTYISALDVQKKQKLQRKLEDFQKRSESEKEQLIEFDSQIAKHGDRVQLVSTLTAYYDWLVKVEPGERSDLRDLASDERLSRIREIRIRQALEEFGKEGLAQPPSKEDAKYILEWCERVFRWKEMQIRDHFPAAYIRYANDNRMPAPSKEILRRRALGNLNSIVGFLIRADRQFVEDLLLDEMPILYDMLSSKARSLLDNRSPDRQRFLILSWVESANQSQRGISIEALKRFERKLSVKDRDRLEKMSSEEYMKTLKRMYIDRRKTRLSPQDLFEQELQELLDLQGR